MFTLLTKHEAGIDIAIKVHTYIIKYQNVQIKII